MSSSQLLQVLVAPIQSEKSTAMGDRSAQYAFRVQQGATKSEIRAAVELMFKVDVDSVWVLNQQGKAKRHGRFQGRRANVRKAYVSLKAGQAINFSELS